jgi:3-oxoacyl-[acyl-carrier-protein] synthase II
MGQRSSNGSRVAITGAGVVTPVGIGIEAFAEALRSGHQNLSHLKDVPVPHEKSAVSCVVAPEFDAPNRAYRMASAVIAEAIRMADFEIGGGEDVALIVSSISADNHAVEDVYERFVTGDSADQDVLAAARLYSNGALLNALGDTFQCFGPRLVITNACASGNIALGLALDLIRLDYCRAVVVVGVETLKLSTVWGAERAGFIGRKLRPFHQLRDGSVLGEGAGALIVERAELATPDRLLGWLEGYGCVCDRGAAPITLLDDGSGLRRSMALALDDAGRAAQAIEYVNAHAPGTRMIDLIECKAVADLCQDHAASVAINATKSLTAHLSAASAIVEAIATLLQMQAGFLHPNHGLDQPDPALAIMPIGVQSIERAVTRSLSNACGGGGLNTTVVLTAPTEPETWIEDRPTPSTVPIGITGIGSVSSLGAGSDDWLAAARELGTPKPGQIPWFDVHQWFPKDTKYGYMNRAAQLAAAAGALAIHHASLDMLDGPYRDDRVAVIAGTHFGGEPYSQDLLCRGLQHDPPLIKPSMSLDNGIHLGAALVCRYFGLTGPTYTLTGTNTSGIHAVAVARDLLISDRADVAVVLGYDALDQPLQHAFSLFSDCASGHNLGEGAGAIVLERLNASKARHVPMQAVVGAPILLSGSFGSAAAIRRLAKRLVSRLVETEWDVIYLAAALDPRLDKLAEYVVAEAGKSTLVRRLQPWTHHCFAADSLLALTTAVARGERALILSVETGGTVAALVTVPQ